MDIIQLNMTVILTPATAKARGIYQNCLQSLVLNVRAEINKIELKLLELVLNSSLDIVGARSLLN